MVGITETTDARKQGRDKRHEKIYLQEEEFINEFFLTLIVLGREDFYTIFA